MWTRSPDLNLSLRDRLSLRIVDESDEDAETKAKMQQFTWTIEAANPSSLEI